MGSHFQADGGNSVTSPCSLSSVFNLCLCVSPRSRICGLQGQCEKPQKCPCFPLLSWCSVPSSGLLTLARALTLEPLPNGDPEAAPRRVLTLVPRPVLSALPRSAYPGPQAPKSPGCPLLRRTSREYKAFSQDWEHSGSGMETQANSLFCKPVGP